MPITVMTAVMNWQFVTGADKSGSIVLYESHVQLHCEIIFAFTAQAGGDIIKSPKCGRPARSLSWSRSCKLTSLSIFVSPVHPPTGSLLVTPIFLLFASRGD